MRSNSFRVQFAKMGDINRLIQVGYCKKGCHRMKYRYVHVHTHSGSSCTALGNVLGKVLATTSLVRANIT